MGNPVLVREEDAAANAGVKALADRLAGLSDARLVSVFALLLFALGAWPLALVDVPPLQDLPNHLATAHIVAHPGLYPEYVFNGFLKSNSLLTLWLHLLGGHGLLGAGRAFTVVALAVNAVALPMFVLHFGGRHRMVVAMLFVWPLVHGFFLSMGMLNFSVAFPLSLTLLIVVDRQRQAPTVTRGVGIALFAFVIWYAHPFPLAVVMGLVAVDVATRRTWGERGSAGLALVSPLAPVGVLLCFTAVHHLVKPAGAVAAASGAFSFLNPYELALNFWCNASGAVTRWGSMTIVPALMLPYFAWKGRAVERPFFSTLGMALIALGYVGLPMMMSNWCYLNSRLVPFLWMGLALWLPASLPGPVAVALALCALSFSAVMGVDYVRLDRDRAAFTAGIDAVPEGAALLPLLFKHRRTSDFTASLTHAWGEYVIRKSTAAPLVFAIERSYPITYRSFTFPPAALIPPALDRFAELHGTPRQVCDAYPGAASGDEADCTAAWRDEWSAFWRKAEPRFTHLLTWSMPPAARSLVPRSYHSIFAADELEIFSRLVGR